MRQTESDAYDLVLRARVGSMPPESSLTYLLALRRYVAAWLDGIDEVIPHAEYQQAEELRKQEAANGN